MEFDLLVTMAGFKSAKRNRQGREKTPSHESFVAQNKIAAHRAAIVTGVRNQFC
jgi:hypothetical protein